MKIFCTALVLLLVLASCKKDATPANTAYPDINVGISTDGCFQVTNQGILKHEWEAQLLAEGEAIKIADFKIIQGVSKGDSHSVYYMLKATCADNKTTMAALLDRKGDDLYLMPDVASVICSAGCGHGCTPDVYSKKEVLYLVCSECADCVKTEFFLNFP